MKAQGKRFLSERGDEGGNVRWAVSQSHSGCNYHEADVWIGDCFKSICLEFSHDGTPKQVDKRIAKLDNLIEELTEFRISLKKSKAKVVTPY